MQISAQQNATLFKELLATMDRCSIPTARPPFSRQSEAMGMTFLSLALRLDHVIRVSENLKLINTDHLSRTVGLDVDLRQLTKHQAEDITVHEATPTPTQQLWVPISRHSREDLAPVIVKNGAGDIVPRLTQNAATETVIAGITRLFRSELRTQHASLGEQREVAQRARWLVEVAVARLIEHGIHGSTPLRRSHIARDEARSLAERSLLDMPLDQSRHYAELLRAACREYFLIVMLESTQSQHYLNYDAPLIPAVRSSTARRRAVRALLPFSTEFTVDYVTQIPRAVGSYHVTVDVPEEIDIRRFILSSNAEESAVADLARRLEALGRTQKVHESVQRAECTELELLLSELGERRHLDVQGFEYYLRNRNLVSRRSDRDAIRVPEGFRIRSLRDQPTRTTATTAQRVIRLARLSDVLQTFQLGLDVSTDNDPRENGAHAQWRPVPLGFGGASVEPVQARVFLALADEPPALVESVARMVGALALVVLGVLITTYIGTLNAKSTCDPETCGVPDNAVLFVGQADAAVAVLLIVPGILLSRLDIQATHSVLGRLRRFPQLVAYTSVVITTILALVIAGANTDSQLLVPAFFVALGTLIVLLLLCFIERFARFVRRQRLVPTAATIPAWLRQEFSDDQTVHRHRGMRPDAYFDAIRPVPNTTRIASPDYEERAARRTTLERSPAQTSGTAEGPARLADLATRWIREGDGTSKIWISHRWAIAPSWDKSYPDELLATAAARCDVEISIRRMTDHRRLPFDAEHPPPIKPKVDAQSTGPQCITWSASEALRPIDIHSNTSSVDFLFDVGRTGDASQQLLSVLRQCLPTTKSAQEDFGAPASPTFVLWPASPPVDRNAPSSLQPATSSCARMSFSLRERDHGLRLRLETSLVQVATVQGGPDIPLWRAKTIPTAGHGDWTSLVEADDGETRTTIDSSDDDDVVPFTFVGPRGEPAIRFLSLIVELLDLSGIRLSSFCAAVLGQFAVINLTAPRRDAADDPSPDASTLNAFVVLGIQADLVREHAGTIAECRFGACVAPMRARSPSARTTSASTPSSLWIDWELPGSAEVSHHALTKIFTSECSPIGRARVAFCRSRRGSDGRLRGRVKLAVDLSGAIKRSDLGEATKLMQSRIIDKLAELAANPTDERSLRLPRWQIFVHVVWNEPWLQRRNDV